MKIEKNADIKKNSNEEKKNDFYYFSFNKSKFNFTDQIKEHEPRKKTPAEIAKIIFDCRRELWKEAEDQAPLPKKTATVLPIFIKKIHEKIKAEGASFSVLQILNDPEAAVWVAQSSSLTLVKEVLLKAKREHDLDQKESPKPAAPQAAEIIKEQAEAERRALKEAKDLAKQHYEEGKGIQTRLVDYGHEKVDLEDSNAVAKIIRLGFLKSHPDKGGNLEKAQFYAQVKDLNEKKVLKDYYQELKILRNIR